MARSARLRLRDLSAIHRLMNECRELGDDPLAWRRHLLAGLVRATGAMVAAEYQGVFAPKFEVDGALDVGWEGGDRRYFEAANAAFAHRGLDFNPFFPAYAAGRAAGLGPAITRADVLPDGDWYRSEYQRAIMRPSGGDATLYCVLDLPGGRQTGVVLTGAVGRPDFAPRVRPLVAELHRAVVALIGGPLAGYADPAPSALPPRTRQVLRCLLDGDSDKQVAGRLGLATVTVNQHTKRIFAHFRVNSRAELLARWVRRGWPIGDWEPPGE